MGHIIRLVLGIAVAVLAVPACLHLLLLVIDRHRHLPQDPLSLLTGTLLALVLVFLRRPSWFLHTAQHEFCHLVACWSMGVRVSAFKVTDGRGGEVEHARVGMLRTIIIAIAPYVLPLVLLPLLLGQHYAPPPWPREVLSGLCGAAWVLHLNGLMHNLRLNFLAKDSDFSRTGRLLGMGLVLCCVLLTTTLAIVVLWE